MPNLPYLIDTNVFLRIVPRTDPDRAIALSAIRKLIGNDEELYYTTQVLAEFWTVRTRPLTARGGYGLSPTETERKVRMIERYCRFVPETVAVHDEMEAVDSRSRHTRRSGARCAVNRSDEHLRHHASTHL
jgi:predicted nucleic acid-binding protein